MSRTLFSQFGSCCSVLLVGAVFVGAMIQPVNAQSTRVTALLEEAVRLEREALEHKQAGRPEAAQELIRHVGEIRAEARRAQGEIDVMRGERQRPEMERRVWLRERGELHEQAGPMDRGELERRAQHLEVAIDNLHAAGFHEPAERLSEPLRRMRQRLAAMPRGQSPHREGPMEAIEDLRAQVGELHRNLRQLRAELEEMRRVGR